MSVRYHRPDWDGTAKTCLISMLCSTTDLRRSVGSIMAIKTPHRPDLRTATFRPDCLPSSGRETSHDTSSSSVRSDVRATTLVEFRDKDQGARSRLEAWSSIMNAVAMSRTTEKIARTSSRREHRDTGKTERMVVFVSG
ncbi:unnamed protein product [Zymoseptoria tritici ST99CH_3D7]|uniref:Uncharacterized protein n=1 Tax=Zymoseptoria tritici (strain ST99CH_3D7) TaxID=1276538 RepID=A0A1X7RBT5_ZYMT9|nr:unnamed protein product [Zymoseptoria tritici ST99CH_3D7]